MCVFQSACSKLGFSLRVDLQAEEIADSLRGLADLDEDATPLLAVFDIPEQQVYALPLSRPAPDGAGGGDSTPAAITAETVHHIVHQFRHNTLPFVPLKR